MNLTKTSKRRLKEEFNSGAPYADIVERLNVFSPFAGIGSEGYVSLQKGRRFIGSELKRSYFDIACKYLEQAGVNKSLI